MLWSPSSASSGSESYALSPINCLGFSSTNLASRVCSTSVISCGEALAGQGDRQRPVPGRPADEAPAARRVLGHRLRRAQGRGETEHPTALHHEIDGLDIHFIHVRSEHEDALPLIVTHGWLGSIIEQLKIIGPLTDFFYRKYGK